ncbi:MAG: TonB-dependent receptor [Candidatus Eremiobacteraeota bacterium]|nr:TonB-dependent receptor [Candidatus Eremiobacteraeota bacterium]
MRSLIACARAASALFVIVAVLAPAAFARAHDDHDRDHGHQNKVDVKGTVTANDGSPIAGASIVLSSQTYLKREHSDARGEFKFRDIRPGTYSVQAAAPGYQALSQRTVTLDAANKTLALVLWPATTNSLTVIGQVRASAGETVSTSSAPTIALNAQAAAAEGVTAVSSMVWKQLSTTPVLPLGGGSNATVVYAVRGPDPTETLVDIDGHPVNNGNTGAVDLSLLDPAALQDVQVIYGISPSSLIGPNTIGGGLNIVTLQPTATPHSLLRIFGGSYGTFGETLQTTGTDDRLGYAVSLHNATSSGSVNQTVLAPPPPVAPPAPNESPQSVGSSSNGNSILTKLRYQLGGANGYGYVQLNFRDQTVVKDDSALLTTYTPPGFMGSGGYQSFAGTTLGAHQAEYGLDAQLPLGKESIDGAPATIALFSHQTTLSSQSVSGPGEATLPYLYNQRDLLGDDWFEIDHHFRTGLLSFKYDLGTETLDTNYVQGQVVAQAKPVGADKTPPVQAFALSQTQRSGVLRYQADPTSHVHYSLALYDSDFSTFGSSFDPRAGFVWTPTGNTAVRASVGTTFQTPQLTELVVPPPVDRVPVGGIVYVGNPNLRPDHATDYDLGMEQILARGRRPLHVAMDWYQTNLRSPSSQLNVTPIPNCQTKRNPVPCPLSYPVNAGNGVYRGVELTADQELGNNLHVLAGWDVDSSFLTVIPPSIQDGTFVAGQQALGQPLHKAYLAVDRAAPAGISYGARLNYEGAYNELNRSRFATLDAHVAYRHGGFEYGLYGTNLTNVYSNPFTIVGGGVPYGALPGQPVILPNAYVLQGAQVLFVLTRTI